MQLNDILRELCLAPGISGTEESAAKVAISLLPQSARARTDVHGSVIAQFGREDAPQLLLEAHLDQIGLIVTAVDGNGFAKIAKVGGMDRRVLLDSEMIIHGKREVPAVICCMPPHLSSSASYKTLPDFDELALDTGLSGEEAKELIPVGSPVTFRPFYEGMLSNRVCAPSLDDRAGVAAIIRTLDIVKENGGGFDALPFGITALFSVQEETGGMGATCASFAVAPAKAIAIDVTGAEGSRQGANTPVKLGKGSVIDIAPILDREMYLELSDIAKEQGLDTQVSVSGGRTGTDADDITISAGGVRCALISLPLKNMHMPCEEISLDDIENCAQLIAAYIAKEAQCNG